MDTPRSYEFDDRLVMSQGVAASDSIATILVNNIPAAVAVHQAHTENDRNGTDWWVEMQTGKMLRVDCKVREEDWSKKDLRYDDLALESWSVVEKQVIGWSRDAKKQTDYILFFWSDTLRWCLIPFPFLCRVFADNWQAWAGCYKKARQFTPRTNGGYHSECIFVPRRTVWAEIYRVFG